MKVLVLLFALLVTVFGQTYTEVQDKCTQICTFEYIPICCTYSDGTRETHGNICAAETYECLEKKTRTAVVDGECEADVPEPTGPDCNTYRCSNDYDPVCCTYPDGSTMTHTNACQAGLYNCLEQKTPKTTTAGACKRFYIMPFPMYPPQIFIPIVRKPSQPQE